MLEETDLGSHGFQTILGKDPFVQMKYYRSLNL